MTQKTVTISWATRKRLALNAFRALLLFTLIYWFLLPWFFTYVGITNLWLSAIQESYTWFSFTMMGVILGYMGFTTLPFIGRGRMSGMNNQHEAAEDENETQGDKNQNYVDPNYKFNARDM